MPADTVSQFERTCGSVIIIVLALFFGTAGCGDYEEPQGTQDIIGTADETITAPDVPTGNVIADIGESIEFSASGAKSSRGHALEYRFDFDAEGERDITNWSSSNKGRTSFSKQGSPVVKAQARCSQHPQNVSPWSEGLAVMVGQGPETEILKVVNSFVVGGDLQVEEIDFGDAIADTVPYGSWITVFYKGTDTTAALGDCDDTINKCLSYQKRYERDSARIPGSYSQIEWRPGDAEDNNPFGVSDSTSMNIGSVEYLIQVRAVDGVERLDNTPAELLIVGNFDPTLDSRSLENHTGEVIGDDGTILWDWWAPADSGVVVVDSELMKTKTFYFVIKAEGHDHPKERPGAGIHSWFYEFKNVGADGTTGFARSDRWTDAAMVNALSDTFTWVAVYPEGDVNGDEIFVNNPPEWNGKSYDFSVMGRDLPAAEEFLQKLFIDGNDRLINHYVTGELGRWTAAGGFRFHIMLTR